MLSDAELETLAKDILTDVITKIDGWESSYFHEIQEMESGELIPVYSATSSEGYGSFLCEYMPLASVKKIIRECEKIFDDFSIKLSDKQTGLTAERLISKDHLPESRAHSIKTMARGATLHLISTFRFKLCEMVEENIKDSELIAKSILTAVVARQLTGAVPGDVTADVRSDIEEAAERVADGKRDMLRRHIKGLPHIIAERGRGAPVKSQAEREREGRDYAAKVEEAYRKLRLEIGSAPTKTKVAKELGEGGVSPHKGSDTSLSAFGNKLRRLKVDYDEIASRVEEELNKKS